MNIKGADRNDTISYSQVIFNPHPANNGTHFFVEVVTVNGKIVSMTPNHLLPLCNGGLVTARSFEEGHCVMTQNVEAGGVYTAVSENEFLVVDGVVASPFALAHGIAHSFFVWVTGTLYMYREQRDGRNFVIIIVSTAVGS